MAINSCFKSKSELIDLLQSSNYSEKEIEQKKILRQNILEEINKAVVIQTAHPKSDGNHFIFCNKWCRACDTGKAEICNVTESIRELITHIQTVKYTLLPESTHSLIVQIPEKLLSNISFSELQNYLSKIWIDIKNDELREKLRKVIQTLYVYWSE